MGAADGFWQPEPPAGSQDQLYTRFQIDPMARGYKNRFDPLPGSDYGADDLALNGQRGSAARLKSHLPEVPHQFFLCTPYGGYVQEHSHVTSQPEASGMSYALTVVQDHIGKPPEPLEGLK